MADPADIAHLLRRTEFVARPERVAALAQGTIAQAVDDVLTTSLNGVVTLPPEIAVHDSANAGAQYTWAVNWWCERMLRAPRPVQEKLTLFWHGHFTSSWRNGGINRSDWMMHQNQLYRELALGDLHELTQRMAIEPAMLVYLNNANNVSSAPNQNFARELLELFTLGVGNYTEDDVVAASRAWTGHNALSPTYAYTFRSTRHDNGDKTFFGITKNWDGPDIIAEILRDNPDKQLVAARRITRKLWEFFAHQGPPAALVDELATQFVAGGLRTDVVVRAMLNRPEFYEPASTQGLVRTPTDLVVALAHHTGLGWDVLNPGSWGGKMGQSLFHPPNVAGWKSNGAWLNTGAVAARAQLARTVASKLRQNGGFDFLHDLSVDAAVDHVAGYFGVAPLSATTRAAIVSAHAAERASTKSRSSAAPTNLLVMMMLAPEFHQA